MAHIHDKADFCFMEIGNTQIHKIHHAKETTLFLEGGQVLIFYKNVSSDIFFLFNTKLPPVLDLKADSLQPKKAKQVLRD